MNFMQNGIENCVTWKKNRILFTDRLFVGNVQKKEIYFNKSDLSQQ